MPKGFPPTKEHGCASQSQSRIFPLYIRPYMHPYAQNNEIDHMVQEMWEVGIIQPRNFSSPEVKMVYKEKWYMVYVPTSKRSQQDHH